MGIEGIDHLKGDEMNDEHEAQQDTTPAAPVSAGPDSAETAPKPDPEPVQPVEDNELDGLEEEGERDVDEMSPEDADSDNTVDNEENDHNPPEDPSV